MKILSLFNNKGGVGKTTLAYHISFCLSEKGYKVLMMDLDPQCNLTIFSMKDKDILSIWQKEDNFIEEFSKSKKKVEFSKINKTPRTIHYLLKPTEEGIDDPEEIAPPQKIADNLDLIPGRLTMHRYENVIAERWNSLYSGVPLSIRTVTRIRRIAEEYSNKYGYDFVIMDTSPSLGILNKVIISTVDGFLVPCLPDMFSLYGIRNIGDYLSIWKKEFETIYSLISAEKRDDFPSQFVRFLGFTIYNAKRYTKSTPNPYKLAQAHYNYVLQIPNFIEKYIKFDVRNHLTSEMLNKPIGGVSIMHSHNTSPSMAQKYKCPMWRLPNLPKVDSQDIASITGASNYLRKLKTDYEDFTNDLLERIKTLD